MADHNNKTTSVRLFLSRCLALLFCVLYSASLLASNNITIAADVDVNIQLNNQFKTVFLEPEVEFEHVRLLPEQRWSDTRQKGASFGFKKDALWLHSDINSASSRQLYLLFDYAVLDNIAVYQQTPSGAVKVSFSGDHLPLDERLIKHRKLVVPMSLEAGINRLYIRIYSTSSYTVPIILLDPASFYEADAHQSLFLAALFGGAVFMMLLNLFGCLRIREPVYIYYVLFALAFTLFNFAIHGYARFYLFQESPFLNDINVVFTGEIGGLAYALFLTVFLPLKKYYRVDYKICQAHAILMGILAFFTLIGFYAELQLFAHLLNATFALYSMALAWRVWRGGASSARFLVFGWMLLMFSVVIKALVALGILAYHPIVFHSFDLGMTLNFAMISVALAHRLVDIQESEQQARAEADVAKNLAIINMEQYRSLFDYAPIPMFKINKHDQFIQANKAFLTLFDYKSEHALLSEKLESKQLYKHKKDYFSILSALKNHEVADIETQVETRSGKHYWLRISVRSLEENGQDIYEGACINVTGQIQQQEFEKQAHRREVKQLEALVSGVAHYLNTPLGTATTAQSVVAGKTEEVEKDMSNQKLTASRLKSFLALIQSSGSVIKNSLQKSVNVVDRFKELNPEEGQVTLVWSTSAELLTNLKVLLSDNVQGKINVVFDDISQKARLIPMGQLLVVLKKLVQNAYLHGDATEVYIKLEDAEKGINIVVKDNGKGLTEDVNVDDLFAPFFAKTLSLQEVSGLDLFVVKTVIQNRLNGNVSINKASLPALQFEIWLPEFEE